ncbi:MAG: hypothetical protein IK083_05055 [Abditibacteriota bacterium]|nr:hypothetical protein [Abditibacteriota bacterium]
MAELTDIHSHLIHGTPDGPGSLDESLSVIRMEYSMGMRHQFVTPAIDSTESGRALEIIAERLEELKAHAGIEFPELTLHVGYTVKPVFDLAKAVLSGAPLTMAGTRYILIDPNCDVCDTLGPLFDSLLSGGFVPIIASPERIKRYRRDPSILEGYLRQGALIEIDVPSIMGVRGNDVKDFADRLLALRWVSFAASDNRRKHFESRLFAGYEYLVAHWRKSAADRLLVENGLKLINNEPIDPGEPEPWSPGKKSFFGRLFGK